MTRRQDYDAHLRSSLWQDLRAIVIERASNKCELCGNSLSDIHHIRYPKDLAGDHAGNLLGVCKTCHNKLHGIYMNDKIDDFAHGDMIVYNGLCGSEYEIYVVMVNDQPWFKFEDIVRIACRESRSKKQDAMLLPGAISMAFNDVYDDYKKSIFENGATTRYVNELGLYQVILQPTFKSEGIIRFQRKVFEEILPSLYGLYS